MTDMILYEKTIDTKNIYSGRVLKFNVDTVELENGMKAERELVLHPGGVGIAAVDGDGYIYMVKQFRKPYDTVLTEIPAGKLEKGEDPELAALRELEEETGIKADGLISLGEFYPSVGYTNEDLHLYLATDIDFGASHPDDDEFVDVCKIHISDAVGMIMSGDIKDGKTIAAVLKAKIYLKI